MIKAYSAFTDEIDDVEAAVASIVDQIGSFDRLKKNTVGLLTCYSDFAESGVVRELCRALPFDVIGSTTLGNAVRGSSGNMLLTILVLTSDDVEFSAGLTSPLSRDDDAPLREAWENASSKLAAKPSLMLSYAPLLVPVSGDFYANAMSAVSGGVPNVGMLAVDNNSDYRDSRVFCGGEAYSDRLAFVLLAGDLDPKFMMVSISPERIFME